MKESTIHHLISLFFLLMAVLHVLAESASYDRTFIAACIFFCSGCILEAIEDKR